MDSSEPRDVVVVGAGPVGLALTLGLARRGRHVLALDKASGIAEHSRAPAIWPGTQEILDDLGVIDAFLREGIALRRLTPWDVARDRPLLVLPLEELAGETRHPQLLILPQPRTEALLLDALRGEPSADVRFGHEVVGVEPDDAGTVVVRFRATGDGGDGGDGGDQTIRTRFVAGCDGAHSFVRGAIGAAFEGGTYRMHAALADVALRGTSDLPFPRIATRPMIAVGIRIAEDRWRLILPFPGDGDSDSDDDGNDAQLDRRVGEAVRALFGRDDHRPVWRSTFRLHRRAATRFARGRIALAGDAAHLNSPVGGQGMNAGIGDAALLAEALDGALESDDLAPVERYAHERRAAVRGGVNRFTNLLTRTLLAGNGRLMRPTFALARWGLRIPPLRRRFLRRLTMLR